MPPLSTSKHNQDKAVATSENEHGPVTPQSSRILTLEGLSEPRHDTSGPDNTRHNVGSRETSGNERPFPGNGLSLLPFPQPVPTAAVVHGRRASDDNLLIIEDGGNSLSLPPLPPSPQPASATEVVGETFELQTRQPQGGNASTRGYQELADAVPSARPSSAEGRDVHGTAPVTAYEQVDRQPRMPMEANSNLDGNAPDPSRLARTLELSSQVTLVASVGNNAPVPENSPAPLNPPINPHEVKDLGEVCCGACMYCESICGGEGWSRCASLWDRAYDWATGPWHPGLPFLG